MILALLVVAIVGLLAVVWAAGRIAALADRRLEEMRGNR